MAVSIEAAQRSTDLTDDLVVALPTSAGKTRVAEIAVLMTLSSERRVLIVTPLRALSAQTERSFRKTFAPSVLVFPRFTVPAAFQLAMKMPCVPAKSSSQHQRSSTSPCEVTHP
jgi:superfamily II DNA or RNA helicase